jgi:hypothetical protein
MALRIQCLCIDSRDPAKTASFWQTPDELADG